MRNAYTVDRKLANKSDHHKLNDLPVATLTNVVFNVSLIITPEALVFMEINHLPPFQNSAWTSRSKKC
jgi:hypothetical protein